MFYLNRNFLTRISIVFVSCLFSTSTLAQSLFQFGNKTLSESEAAGQLMMIGVAGTSINKKSQKHLSQIKPGSIILFKRNIPDAVKVKSFTQQLQGQKFNSLPLIIAIDQEGGDVVRLQTAPPLPSAFSIARSLDIEFIGSYSSRLSEFMQSAGINMNLAPVLDLSDPNKSSFLGARSFGNNPRWVGKVGTHFGKNHIHNFVIPVAKHFPGMGHTSTDPHFNVGQVNLDLPELEKESILPFREFSTLGRFSGMMMSHFIYPAFDSKHPASLSKPAMNFLRNSLGYKGLIITDDLQMDAVKSQIALEDAAVLSLGAGADIVMVAYSPESQKRVHRRILKAIRSKELSKKDVQEKLDRLAFVKQILTKSPKSDVPKLLALRNFSDYDNILLKNKLQQLKRMPSSISPGNICLFSDVKSFKDSFTKNTKLKVKTVSFKDLGSSKSTKISGCNLIVLAVSKRDSSKKLKGINDFLLEKSLIVNLGLPALTQGLERYQVINLDFPHAMAGKKIAQLIP